MNIISKMKSPIRERTKGTETNSSLTTPIYSSEDSRTSNSSTVQDGLLRLALFGDSSAALGTSFLLLAIAVILAINLDGGVEFSLVDFGVRSLFPAVEDAAYRELGPRPKIGPPTIFQVEPSLGGRDRESAVDNLVSIEMRELFDKEGVIAIRGLLDPKLLDELDQESMKLVIQQREKEESRAKVRPKVLTGRPRSPKQFFTVNQGVIFLPSPSIDSNDGNDVVDVDEQNDDENISVFAKVALMSPIRNVVAALLNLDGETCTNETIRVMRDIFLAKDEEEYICGWHVDDIGFWPALADAPGINAWIALDDMPVRHGGGFALAVGSHRASWREVAYNVTGSTHTFPKDGYKSLKDTLQSRPGNGTCNIKDSAPHLYRRMEESKRIYEIKRGDIIFHARWLFHRTIPFGKDAIATRVANNGDPLVYRRYSIRYGPGSSIIPPGYGSEPSVLSNGENGGRTADEVSRLDAPWYPKAWPQVCPNELAAFKVLAKERVPAAMEKSEERRKVMRPRRTE